MLQASELSVDWSIVPGCELNAEYTQSPAPDDSSTWCLESCGCNTKCNQPGLLKPVGNCKLHFSVNVSSNQCWKLGLVA